jgi:hypothetical protein
MKVSAALSAAGLAGGVWREGRAAAVAFMALSLIAG